MKSSRFTAGAYTTSPPAASRTARAWWLAIPSSISISTKSAHAVLLAQHQGQGGVEEVVAGDAQVDGTGVFPAAAKLQHPLEVRVGFFLGRVRRPFPAVHLGFDGLHGQVCPFDNAQLNRCAAGGDATSGPVGQRLLGSPGIREVRLQHDSGTQGQELRLVQNPLECRQREMQVAVFLHVEVDEFAVGLRRAVKPAQAVLDVIDCSVPVEQVDLTEDGRDFDGDIVNGGIAQVVQDGVHPPLGFRFA